MRRIGLPLQIISALILLIVLLAAPLAGAAIRGAPVASYLLQFPPVTTMADHSSFSWMVFLAVLIFVLGTTWPFWRRLGRGSWRILYDDGAGSRERKLPGWGWLALVGLILFWVLAWTRFPWFEPFQRFTFFPLWFCFIVFLNAVAVWMSGKSLLTQWPVYFFLLFPVSAAFWWGFEYLNRFVSNWHYIGTAGIGGWQYFWEASLAFSTVLPAVMSVRFMLIQIEVFARGYRDFPAAPGLTSSSMWKIIGVIAVFALVAIGWLPRLTYPLIWIVPGLLWIAWQRWKGYVNPMLKDVSEGDYTMLWASALAALICGFFWEMWNFYSEAHWVYSIPALDRFEVFEMPLAGYAGYLPFGVVCALVAQSLFAAMHSQADEEPVVLSD